MALSDRVIARFSAQELRNLTNPDKGGQSTYDSARLGYACDDVEADFRTYAQVTYDDDDARHVAVAVIGVRAKLQQYGGSGGEDLARVEKLFHDRLRQLGRVSSRARVEPKSSSAYTPSELDSTQTIRPPFDDRVFDGVAPSAPLASGSDRYEDDGG